MDRYTLILEELRKDDYRRLRSFAPDGTSRFTTWLVVVCSRICVDHVRRKYGQKTSSEASPALVARRNLVDLAGPQSDEIPLPAPEQDAPDVSIRRKELDERIEAAIAELDPEDRLLIQLRFHDDLSARQIAPVLGLATPFHVYRRIDRLRSRLRALLERRGVVSADP